MKRRTISTMFLMFLLFSLAGCGSSDTNEGNTSQTEKTEQSKKDKEKDKGQDKEQDGDKDKNPSKGDKGSKEYDYPEVTAYYMADGELKTESFALSPEHEFFSKESFSWELDLGGKNIELKDIFEMKTDVRIVNGRITTGANGYIVNNGTLRLGDVNNLYSNAYEEKGIAYLTFREKGIVNNGQLIMESTDSTVESGTGILNSGKIAPSFDESYNYFNHAQPVIIKGGTFLENSGEAYFGNFQIVVDDNLGIINREAGKLYLFEASEVAVGTGTGINNLGTMERFSSYGEMKYIISVEGGIGIDNSGLLGGMADLWVDGGTAIYNRSTGVVGEEDENNVGSTKEFMCWSIVDKGTAFVNEGKFYGSITSEIKNGTLLANKGKYRGRIRAAVAKEEAYEGIMLENSANAIWEGGMQVKVSALKNATIFKNGGTYRAGYEEMAVYTGAYYDNWEHNEWQDWIDREFGFDQRFPIENSTIIRVEKGAVWEESSVRMALVGTVTGTAKGIVFEDGSECKGNTWLNISLFANDAVGLTMEQGTILSGLPHITGRIGMGGSEELAVYCSLPKLIQDEEIKNTCVMKNYATIPEFHFNLESCSGNNCIGMENLGIVESFTSSYFYVQGNSNVGLVNRGTFNGGSLFVGVKGKENRGNNFGAVNHSVMNLEYLACDDEFESYGNTVTTLIPESAADCVDFRNEALAVLKVSEGITAHTTSPCVVAFENYGNLTAGDIEIESYADVAFIQRAGGYTKAAELSVGNSGRGPALVVEDLMDIEGVVSVDARVHSGTAVDVATLGTITSDYLRVYASNGSTGITNSGNLRGRGCGLFSDVSGAANCIRGGGKYFEEEIYIDDKYVFWGN